ncbi:Carboxylesterase 5A [Paraconiothyrium brasiliense]|uniref:Carboxylesterase 5A n=1 Tax=Paraconiothyrium brasiliense TaxID=300254 RepID=A0ABR3RFG2_9PLEO
MVTLHTSFGSFKGIHGEDVVQYLGIKYAKVKDQLSAPDMMICYEGVVDATEYGPRAPAADASLFEQQVLIQQVIDDAPSQAMSGMECLNLNITVPSPKTEERKALPVMVFIHGGGYIMGSNSAPYFKPSRFVALSVELGTPVIVVSIK